MFRSFVVLLLTVAFTSVAFAQQRHVDAQSLQYEFGRPMVRALPCPPVLCSPVVRVYGCASVHAACYPYYTPCCAPCCYPAPKVYRRACVRPVYHTLPYYRW